MGTGIAIIGLSCRFSGAEDPAAFWQMLCEGRSATLGPVPSLGLPPEARSPFVPDAFQIDRPPLDAGSFGLSEQDAAALPGAHRLGLELAVEALDDAGIPLETLRGTPASVYVGTMWQTSEPGRFAHSVTASLRGAIAGRIAHHLDLRGPALVIDTATSSALVAVHFAVQSLELEETPIALAGGVNLIDYASSAALWRLGVLSEREIRPFDRDAGGYVRGEGGAFIVLKRLRRAVSDGDRIYAVIRGSAINHDGATRPFVAPSTAAQIDLLRAACARSGVPPHAVEYVEAHGTGTAQGDRCEAAALGAVFGDRPANSGPVRIGSVKANVGHLEGASGIAGLVKMAMAFHHEYLPPSRNCSSPSPDIAFEQLQLTVQTSGAPWPQDTSRVAGVTSLGLCGTNCHVVVQGRRAKRCGASRARPHGPHLLVLSARTPETLAGRVHAFVRWCAMQPAERLRDVCFTAAVRRAHDRCRVAVVGSSLQECAMALSVARGDADPQPGDRPRLVFAIAGRSAYDRAAYRQLIHRFAGIRATRAPRASTREEVTSTALSMAAWFCQLGLVPDAIVTDAPDRDPHIAEALRAAIPADRRPRMRDAILARVENLATSERVTVVTFGECGGMRRRWPRTAVEISILPSTTPVEAVLQAIGALYCQGFDPDWLRVFSRCRVVALPPRTWSRASAASTAPAPATHDPRVSASALAGWVRQQVSEILSQPDLVIEGDEPLLSLGLDSLAALDLEERLRATLGVELRLLRHLDHLTTSAIVERASAAVRS